MLNITCWSKRQRVFWLERIERVSWVIGRFVGDNVGGGLVSGVCRDLLNYVFLDA